MFKQCFKNSYNMAIRHGITYVEGIASKESEPLYPQHHAWCIDSDGKVLDRTWGIAFAYFGIPFKTKFVRALLTERKQRRPDSMYYGVLDDWQSKHPLINLYGEQPELWLAISQS
jgi:hypothetical protein